VLLNTKFKHDRPDMPECCGEQWDWEFIEWVWNFRTEILPTTMEYLKTGDGRVKVITLRTSKEVAQFLEASIQTTRNIETPFSLDPKGSAPPNVRESSISL